MRLGGFLGALAVTCALLFAATELYSARPDDQIKLIARGKYLAIGIGGCHDCHTPRDQKGQFIQDKWLQGSELFMKPAFPIPGWTAISPGIAGLPNWTDQQAIRFLNTGIAPDGTPANPPMPQYRFNRADAKAVVAYLRSLKPVPQPLGHTKENQPKQ
jgi:mono/diheme cytochrome c family protein